MTTEIWTVTPEYTVAGIGPYTIIHPYAAGAMLAFVVIDGERTQLTQEDFSVSPAMATTTGDLYLTPAAAATHAGRTLIIDRQTPDEQGWLGVQGEREAGLEAQLDLIVQALQEVRAGGVGALRIRGVLQAFDWADGTVPLRQGTRVVSGPTAADIASAAANATVAIVKAAEAAASAAEALDKENTMVRQRGAWVTATLYSPSDQFTFGGELYGTLVGHYATTVAADLGAGRILKLVEKGATGAGSGDVVGANAGSEYTANQAAFRANIGLAGLAIKNLVAFADIEPAAIISDVETLAANKLTNALPCAKAITDYVDFWESGRIETAYAPSVTVAGIPAWANRVELLLDRNELIAAEYLRIRLGTAGGLLTAGYETAAKTEGVASGYLTTGFSIYTSLANNRGPMGCFTFHRIWDNHWIGTLSAMLRNFNGTVDSGGRVDLGAPLTQLQIRSSGTANFGSGWICVRAYRN